MPSKTSLTLLDWSTILGDSILDVLSDVREGLESLLRTSEGDEGGDDDDSEELFDLSIGTDWTANIEQKWKGIHCSKREKRKIKLSN